MANIKYKIFRNRKNFNVVNWLRRNSEKTYKSFVDFLETKGVIAPDEEYFNKALDFFNSLKEREESFKENKETEVVQEKKETIPIDVEISLPEVEEVKEVKTKSRRGRRKKDTNES